MRTAYLDETIVVKLINTCPIVNYLTIFYLYLKSHPAVMNTFSESSPKESYAKCLSNVVFFSQMKSMVLVKSNG